MNEFKLSDGIDENIFLLNFSDLDSRYDPKYNKYLQKYQQTFKASFGIGELLTKKPMYGANERAVTYNGNCRYIRITDIDEFGLLKNTGLKSAKFENMKYQLKFNDILFARSGATVGKTYIHKDKSLNAIFAGYMIRFKIDDKKVSPDYIFIYTQLNIYKEWVQAIQRSTGQPNINAEEYQNLNVPIPPKNIQQDVINIMDNTYIQKKQKEKQAKDLLDSIDIYLLDELGITLPKIDNSLEKRIFEVNLSEISGNRFDPDYYSYHYKILQDAILQAKINEINIDEIDSVVSIIKGGKTPASSDYSDIKTSFPLIKAGSYTDEYINLQKLGYTKEENNFEAQKEDIFILSAAHQSHYVGRQIKILNENIDNKISYVGELICIRTIKELCNPMYLFSLLNIDIYKILLNREKTGQTSHIYGKDIKKIKIPLPPIEKQNEMAEHIQKIRDTAKQLKTEAVQDFKNAKLEVEKMILGQ
jgi:type I restriction enzyme M protein